MDGEQESVPVKIQHGNGEAKSSLLVEYGADEKRGEFVLGPGEQRILVLDSAKEVVHIAVRIDRPDTAARPASSEAPAAPEPESAPSTQAAPEPEAA